MSMSVESQPPQTSEIQPEKQEIRDKNGSDANSRQVQSENGSRHGEQSERRERREKREAPSASASTKLSKALSYLLRHGAQKEKLNIRNDGFVRIDEILSSNRVKGIEMPLETQDHHQQSLSQSQSQSHPEKPPAKNKNKKQKNSRSPNLHDILELVDQNDKKRFQILDERALEEGEGGNHKGKNRLSASLWIRAVQGHSLTQVSSLSHTPITLSNLSLLQSQDQSPTIIHGTSLRSWQEIKRSRGLSTMKRNHIHLARGLPSGFQWSSAPIGSKEERGVGADEGIADGQDGSDKRDEIISGFRPNSQILIYVDIKKALADGVDFFLSQNGVVLTPGVKRQAGGDEEEEGKGQGQGKGKENGKHGEGFLEIKYFEKVLDRKGQVVWEPNQESKDL